MTSSPNTMKPREFWVDPENGQIIRVKPFASDYVRFVHVIELTPQVSNALKQAEHLTESVAVLESLRRHILSKDERFDSAAIKTIDDFLKQCKEASK